MSQDRYWLNPILDEIASKYPEGKIIVSSGISPSASYHIGHFRELLSADLVAWGLKERGREVDHIHVVDNFDPLRKRYSFLPENYENYVGWPVCLVPDPDSCHESYADHFFSIFYEYVEKLNVEVTVIKSYEQLYKTGRMTAQIEKALENIDLIKSIFAKITNRHLPDNWAPIQILSDDNNFHEWQFVELNKDKQELTYRDSSGKEGQVSYKDGRVKLQWRLDWPARWDLLNVMVEPHGHQEHGAAGGSFQTGKEFAKRVYGVDGPLAGFQYGHIHMAGDNIKMSSSKGNIVTPEQAFKFIPPEMIRYLYARYPGKKKIDFDPGLGLFRLMDEFSAVDRAVRAGKGHEFGPAYKYAIYKQKTPGMSSISYNHLVTIYQSALGDKNKIYDVLRRTGYQLEVDTQTDALNRELEFVTNWLEEWAPEEIKFSLAKKLPRQKLSSQQKELLSRLKVAIAKEGDNPAGEWYHSLIHDLKQDLNLDAKDAFSAIYRVLLDRDEGPKAGWFLSILDKDWLLARLEESQQLPSR